MEDLLQVLAPVKELLLPTLLSDKSLMAADNPIELAISKAYPIDTGDVTFTFGAGASVAVMLFNDEDDKDPDNLLSVKDTPLTFDTASEAFLKYTNQVSAKANGAATLESIGFNMNLSASGSAKTVYYKKHAGTEAVNAAFLNDIKSFKTILRGEDLQTLEEGNALGFIVNGTLSASLSLSWSGIFSKSLSLISKLFTSPITLDVNIAPSFTGSFKADITDDFSCIIKKEAADQCLVSFNRKKSKAIAGSASASVSVGFADTSNAEQQLLAIYDKVCTSVFGKDSAGINEAIDKWKQNAGDISQNALVAKLLAYFKLENVPAAAQALLDKLAALQQKVITTIGDIAKASVQASFTYQYERIEENETVLSVSIATADVQKHHAQLLRLNPSGLLDDMRRNAIPYKLHNFLQQSVLTVSSSYGFGFKLFDVVNLTSSDYSNDKVTTIVNFAGNQQIKVDATRGYKWQLGKGKGSWLGDFSATTNGFSATPAPSIKDFSFSLLMEMITVDPNMKKDDLQAYLDAGVLWGSVRAQDVAALVKKYTEGGLLNKPVTVDVKLSFNDHAMSMLLQQVAAGGWGGQNINVLAKAMGAAMTWLSDYQWRSTPEARQNAYAGLWLGFLNNPSADVSDYGAAAADFLDQQGAPDQLAEFEGNADNWTFGDSFAGVIRSNPGLFNDLKTAVLSLVALQQMVQAQQAYNQKKFQNWLKGFMPSFSQSFYVRTLGYFLLQHAATLNLGDNIQTTITLTVGSGDDAQVITIAAS